MAQSKFMRMPIVVVAIGGFLAGCGGGTSAPPSLAATETTTGAATELSVAPTLTPPSALTPISAPSPIDTAAAAGAGEDGRPGGDYVIVKRLEKPDPPYDGFIPGQPDVRNWDIQPQCDFGACDLDVGPSADGLMPGGSPPPEHPDGAFTLALQPDGSYFGSADFPDVSCSGSDGDVADGALFQYTYKLTYTPPSGSEAPRLTGTVLDTQVPNDVGKAAGCIEYHDSESLVAQPRGIWNGVDPAQLHFGTYDWGGRVTSADDYFLAHTAVVGDYRILNSRLTMKPTCTTPCTLHTTGVAPDVPSIATDFTWASPFLVGSQSFQNTCTKNGTDQVLFNPGYDETSEISLTPVIIVGGEVLAWIGTLVLRGTPLSEAAAGSPTDCFPTNEEYSVIAATPLMDFGLGPL